MTNAGRRLVVCHLSKTIGDVPIVNDFSMVVHQGECLGILGANGAGKTTAVGMMTGVIRMTSGSVTYAGCDLQSCRERYLGKIGRMPQDSNLFPTATVMDVLVNQAGYHGIKRKDAIRQARQLAQVFAIDAYLKTECHSLSGGTKKKVMLTRALLHHPELVFLDEPSAGIDLHSRRMIWDHLKVLKEKGKSLVLTSHNFEEIALLCDSVLLIDRGEVTLPKTTIETFCQGEDVNSQVLERRFLTMVGHEH